MLRRALSSLLPARAMRDRVLALGEGHAWPYGLPRESAWPPLMSPMPQRPPQPEAPSTLGSERAFAVVGAAVGVALRGGVGDEIHLHARPTLRLASPTSCEPSSTPCRPSGYGGTWI